MLFSLALGALLSSAAYATCSNCASGGYFVDTRNIGFGCPGSCGYVAERVARCPTYTCPRPAVTVVQRSTYVTTDVYDSPVWNEEVPAFYACEYCRKNFL